MTGSISESQEEPIGSAKSAFMTLSLTVHAYEMFIKKKSETTL